MLVEADDVSGCTLKNEGYPDPLQIRVARLEGRCRLHQRKRVVRFFPTREEADNYLREAKGTLKTEGTDGSMVSPADRILFSSWKERLESAGSSIEEAAGVFLKWRDRLALAGGTIEQAGTFFLTHHSGLKEAPNIYQLGRDYLESMLAGGDSALNTLKTVEDLKRPNLASFFRFLEGREIGKIGDITRDHVEDWLEAIGGASETKKNRIRTIRHFLERVRRNKYISINPLMGRDNTIAIGEEKKGDILSYGLKEMRALLCQALVGQHRSKFNRHTEEFEYVS